VAKGVVNRRVEAVLRDAFDALGHWTGVARIPSVVRLPAALESL
jgi:hypothetical protein